MKLEIKEVSSKEEWEDFLAGCAEKTFLQAWAWGDFSASGGNAKIWRFGAYYENRLSAVALTIKHTAKRGTFLLIPHGPVIKENFQLLEKKEIMQALMDLQKKLAIEEKAVFVRICPIMPETGENIQLFKDLGFKEAPIHASAYEATWKLDIYPAENELLKNMRKTTRYLIKKTRENPDIEIIKSVKSEDIKIYQELNKKVSKRQKFVPFSEKFIENEFEIFAKNQQVLLLFGKYKNEVVAGAMVIFWGGTGFYHQAASLNKFAKQSVPYLIQWEAIKEAKNRGCVVYDFWGFTDPEKFPNHPWAGPTLFKMGFGGYKTQYVKTQDYIISNKYWINYLIEKIRKIRRGL